MPAILVNIPYVQRRITTATVNELSKQLGVPVQIDRIGIRWINRLTLEGVSLEDRSGEIMFEANHVSAGFELLPFFQGKFVFNTVRLFGFSLNLNKESPQEELNLQFVIDTFASKDTLNKSPDVDLRFNSILLRRGKLRYDVLSERTTPGKFNPKHIDIENVSANISLKAFNSDSLNAHIKKLSFDEVSGFSLEKLSMNVVSNRDSAYIDNFEVRLPQSRLQIDKAAMSLSPVKSYSLSSFLDDAPLELSIAPSRIFLKDLSAFIPAFQNFNDTLEISAKASGYINNINLERLHVRQRNFLEFDGHMEMRGITHPGETYVYGQVSQLYITSEGLANLMQNFNSREKEAPELITRLGTIHFTGEVSGFFDNLVAYGKFSSDIGSLETDIIFGNNKEKNIAAYIRGHAATPGLHLEKLFGEESPYGIVRFNMELDASTPVNGNLAGNIRGAIEEFEYKGYTYENILLAGNFQKNGFDGMLHMNDPNGEIRIDGMFQNEGQNSVFKFNTDVRHLRLDKLLLTEAYESPEISFSLNADFTGNTIDNVEGSILLDSFSFQTTSSDFLLKRLDITAHGHSEDRKLTISSDILNGEVVGAYSFTTILPSFMQTFEGYLPSLIHFSKQKEEQAKENNFSILLTVENTESLSNTFKLPVTILDQARVTGHYNNRYDKFRLEAWFPKFNLSGSMFESGYLSCQNPDQKIDFQVKAINYNNNGLRNYLSLNANAGEDRVNTLVSWANNKEQLYKADFSASTLFVKEEDERKKSHLRTEVTINESFLSVKDSLWHIPPAAITVKDNKIDIDNFFITHNDQFVHLDGSISQDLQDTLVLDLRQIELRYIFEILDIPVLQFAGEATGTFFINDLYESRRLHTDLDVENFSFNDVTFGHLSLYSEWDDIQQGILMLGSIYKNDSTWTDVNGYIYPVKPKEGLSLHFDANDIDISFVQPFLADVATNIQGNGFGHVHLFGSFSDVTIEGETYIENGGLGIDFLNTYYTFSDSIHLTPTSIRVNNLTVYDKFRNAGKVDMTFNHAYFRDYDFKATIQANNMLLYDQPEKNSPMIYGTAFGSGTGVITGNENIIDFDVNVRSNTNTSVGFNFMTSSASDEYDFITFIDKSQPVAETDSTDENSGSKASAPADSGTEIRMNVQVEVTPDAMIELIMDPSAGDRIKGTASGSLQVQYGTRTDLRMFGGVNIIEGNYNFSLQQLIYKDFKIREGSAITFHGDPFAAIMDINAIYSLTANIKDLNEGLTAESDRANIPVNCVLLIDGMMQNPDITFDIELPGSNEEIERQVRSFIDTQDMMSMQIVYLLVLNKFYTPDYATNFSAVASSALSSQLSNMLNTITDKVQIGTNIRTSQDGIEDTEVEMLLSTQLLDNRLLFNGNFGYRNSYAMDKSVFIGEFDLEYLLIPSGEIRLKAFNHTNDMYQQFRQSPTTQGVGIMFKKDFTRLSNIFRKRKRPPLDIIKPEEEEESLPVAASEE